MRLWHLVLYFHCLYEIKVSFENYHHRLTYWHVTVFPSLVRVRRVAPGSGALAWVPEDALHRSGIRLWRQRPAEILLLIVVVVRVR